MDQNDVSQGDSVNVNDPDAPERSITKFLTTAGIAGVIAAGIALPAVGITAYAANTAGQSVNNLPAELQTPPLPTRTTLLAVDGTRIATLYKENRIEVPMRKISKDLQHAIVAVEDARFYEHNGIDIKGTVRAALASGTGGQVQGGSSITQQYVKNVLVTAAKTKEEAQAARARTIARKLQEARYAIALEKRLSKKEILNRYLNIAYFGAGAYGAEAASRRFFSKSADELSLSQSALLAGLVQLPVGYDPLVNPKKSGERRAQVLRRMVDEGYITEVQESRAAAIPVKNLLKPSIAPNGCADSKYPFYCDYVEKQIEKSPAFGDTRQERIDFLKQSGATIRTAMDIQAQNAAQNAAKNYIPADDPSRKAAALAMVTPKNGNVVALGQNREWGTKGAGKTTYNYAVSQADGGTIGMQAGSTFKIFTLIGALEAGIDPYTVISAPPRRTFYGGSWGCKGEKYEPYSVGNSTSSGAFNMFQGTAYSVNTYFVELELRAGLCRVVSAAKRLGMRTGDGGPIKPYPSLTLGSLEVTPLAMASAYAGVANHGKFCKPRVIVGIRDRDGDKVKVPKPKCKQVIKRDVADATTAILSGVVDGGISGRTGQAMSLGRDATGKTGTTDSSAAVWFAGYTPDLAAAVWVGDPRGGFQYPMKNVLINGSYYSQVFGSSLPGPIWRSAMLGALANKPYTSFDLQAKYGLRPARQGGGGTTPSGMTSSTDTSTTTSYTR